MNSVENLATSDREACATYYVDEAGDGVLFGPQGRNRLNDRDGRKFFALGMVQSANENEIVAALSNLRAHLLANPLYATIHSLRPDAGKTARYFHAKDDHAEVRAKVFELLVQQEFKFFAVIKDMRAVLDYVVSRNKMHLEYKYRPNELYDLTVRMLFKQRLHKDERIQITFARRGHADRTAALRTQLEVTRQRFQDKHGLAQNTELTISPAYPFEAPMLQVADFCLWALQRCYENHEARFLHAIWPKVSLIHDVNDPSGTKKYGRYLTRKDPPPDPVQIKNRWI